MLRPACDHRTSPENPPDRSAGVGESHLAKAIGYELIKSGKVVLCRSIFHLLADLREDGFEANHQRTMKRYLKCTGCLPPCMR